MVFSKITYTMSTVPFLVVYTLATNLISLTQFSYLLTEVLLSDFTLGALLCPLLNLMTLDVRQTTETVNICSDDWLMYMIMISHQLG